MMQKMKVRKKKTNDKEQRRNECETLNKYKE